MFFIIMSKEGSSEKKKKDNFLSRLYFCLFNSLNFQFLIRVHSVYYNNKDKYY